MIEIGILCTVWPDSHVEYEITEIRIKTLEIAIENRNIKETYYFVDLKKVDDASIVKDVPIYNINLLNN